MISTMKSIISFVPLIILGLASYVSADFESANVELIKELSSAQKHHRSTANQCNPIDVTKLEKQGLLHSQDYQDKCLLTQYFPGICHGSYIEVGALDGDRYSNTFAFYNSPKLNWKGINIEVDPLSYEKLSVNRKNDIANVHAATCSDPGIMHFFGRNRPKGGIWEFSTPEQRKRWWGPYVTLQDTTPVQCTHLQVILDQTVGSGSNHYFDMMSVDIEGAELSALQSIDFNRVGFGVIIVGKQGRDEIGIGIDSDIEKLLLSVGYEKVVDKKKTCGSVRNNWFVNKDFDRIYAEYKNGSGSTSDGKEDLVAVKKRRLGLRGGHVITCLQRAGQSFHHQMHNA